MHQADDAAKEEELPSEEPVFKKVNRCQALLLIVTGSVMLSFHITVMADKGSWIVIDEGLRETTGNLPAGSDEFTGTYASVAICYAVAETSTVSGFVWMPSTSSPYPYVDCEFKRYGTPLEKSSVVNRKAVIKSDKSSACGLFRCRNTPNRLTDDIYDCGDLQSAINGAQSFSILVSITIGTHLILQVLLWTDSWGKRVAPVLDVLPKSYFMQAVLLSITWSLLASAYRSNFCGRRISDVSRLSYGLWFCVVNTLLCYICHVVTKSAFSYRPPTPDPYLSDTHSKRRSTVASHITHVSRI